MVCWSRITTGCRRFRRSTAVTSRSAVRGPTADISPCSTTAVRPRCGSKKLRSYVSIRSGLNAVAGESPLSLHRLLRVLEEEVQRLIRLDVVRDPAYGA